jgi:hypothetical protein
MSLAKNFSLYLPVFWGLFAAAGEEGARPEEVSVSVHVQEEWVPLPVKEPGVGQTRSALRTRRAVDPVSGRPYDRGTDVFGCDPAELRRSFRLDKKEYILGEPILVEFRIELGGEGTFRETVGGCYRARGRDDNFLFLLRHKDGTWVEDPHAPVWGYMGGISTEYEVRRDRPYSAWFAVQRWCTVERPGTYDLYCFQSAHGHRLVGRRAAIETGLPDRVKEDHRLDEHGSLIDARTGKRSNRYSLSTRWEMQRRDEDTSPLVAALPEEVRKHAKPWSLGATSDFAHLTLTIRKGNVELRESMVRRWAALAEVVNRSMVWASRAEAAQQAMCFARQDDFLPVIETWLKAKEPRYFVSQGLGKRSSPAALALLLRLGTWEDFRRTPHWQPRRVHEKIPALIELLAHEEAVVRERAESCLRAWTGQTIGRATADRPASRDEGRAMQPLWRTWWRENREGFVPLKPR